MAINDGLSSSSPFSFFCCLLIFHLGEYDLVGIAISMAEDESLSMAEWRAEERPNETQSYCISNRIDRGPP